VRCEMLAWIAKQAPSGPWHPRRPTADDTARVRVDRPNGDTSNKRPVALKGHKFVRILPERDYTQRLKKANSSRGGDAKPGVSFGEIARPPVLTEKGTAP
jgi:hypothetical protein